MGMSEPDRMRAGLLATKTAAGATVGTITLDSYTRVGDLDSAQLALMEGVPLNGYPIVSHDLDTTRRVLDGIRGDDFPIQVRHGSAAPQDIFVALMTAGLDATEGGPISYCLPYGRIPLAESLRNWSRSCELFTRLRDIGRKPHLETFGGCMLGQLCPPSQLVAISVLEALFFYQHGLRSISLSYAQQTNKRQDVEAVHALRRLCDELLPDVDWHVVIYAYMGVYPTSSEGAYQLLGEAATLAAATGSERLIVKTVAESVRIPTIEENVSALEYAAATAARYRPDQTMQVGREKDSQTYAEAEALVAAVLNLGADVGRALELAFRRGYLDIPYCLHPDNNGRTRTYLDAAGRLRWADTGKLPLTGVVAARGARTVTSSELLESLSYVRRKFDSPSIARSSAPIEFESRGA
jgi:methylaspartate mutase epsilon subunit